MLKRLVLGAVTAWAAWGFLAEMGRAAADWDRREQFVSSWGWRFHTPQTDALARSLDLARTVVPPGAVIAFTAPDDPPGEEFLAWRWTAYLSPENDVIPVDDPATGRIAEYALGYHREIHHPRAELVLRLPDGWLYRVRKP